MRRGAPALTLAAILAALPAMAQQPGRIYRVAIVNTGTLSVIAAGTMPELARQGFVDGRNLVVTRRSDVAPDQLAAVAREIVDQKPDLIIAVSDVVIRAFADATKTIPILMSFSNDPIAEGFVASLTRPGGNLTGQMLRSTEQTAKRIEILRQAVPMARHLAILTPGTNSGRLQAREALQVAERMGVRLSSAEAATSDEYRPALERLKAQGAEAVLVASNPRFARDASDIARVAGAIGLPTMCEWDYMARAGCLLSFGPDQGDLRLRTAQLAARILNGASPADLPIEGPDRFELVINLKTAKQLGVTIPPNVLARADKVIR